MIMQGIAQILDIILIIINLYELLFCHRLAKQQYQNKECNTTMEMRLKILECC